jgi:hypothetical protein
MRGALMSYMARYDREHYVKRKIRRDIYSKLMELSKREGLGLQELLEKLVKVYEGYREPISTPYGEPISVELHWDQFWFLIRVGRGWGAIEISLNLIQAEKLCKTKLLNRSLCLKLAELAPQWSPLKSLK